MNIYFLKQFIPYWSPEPFRGKTNYPNNIKIVGEKIAEIKNISVEDVLKVTENVKVYLI